MKAPTENIAKKRYFISVRKEAQLNQNAQPRTKAKISDKKQIKRKNIPVKCANMQDERNASQEIKFAPTLKKHTRFPRKNGSAGLNTETQHGFDSMEKINLKYKPIIKFHFFNKFISKIQLKGAGSLRIQQTQGFITK